jgi:transcriptional regulator with XRE-family HTH domain
MSDIFNIRAYQDVIRFQLERSTLSKGAKTRLAEVAGVQPAYLSQVLSGSTHLSLDQAANMADYWDFSDSETDYFLDLVALARAGSPHLKKRLHRRITELKEAAEQNPFISDSRGIEWELASTYYSDPIFSAIHLNLRIEKLQTIDSLAEHLSLPKSQLRALLNKMLAHGLVTHSLDRWLPVERNLHAEPDSIFAKMHHRNWHIKAIDQLTSPRPEDLFYTAVHTLSNDDFVKIADVLLTTIRKARKTVVPSADETGAALSISWFKI